MLLISCKTCLLYLKEAINTMILEAKTLVMSLKQNILLKVGVMNTKGCMMFKIHFQNLLFQLIFQKRSMWKTLMMPNKHLLPN